MFDPDIIDSLNSHDRQMIRRGLEMILETGIAQKQREASFARLFAGSVNEEPDVLANKIVKARAVNLALDSLEELSGQLKEYIHESIDIESGGVKL